MFPIVAPPPCWLDTATLHQLRRATAQARARGEAPQVTSLAIRDVIRGRHPALSCTAIDEATSLILGDNAVVPSARRSRPAHAGEFTFAHAARPRLLFARIARIAARFRPPP